MRKIEKRIDDTIQILKSLGLPKAQHNDRSALCLLALLNLTLNRKWFQAESPLIGITPIMDWVHKNYKKSYAPNSRETFRRYTMHQFVQAGIALYNPDKPDRPVNSPLAVYQIEQETLDLLRCFDTKEWELKLDEYLKHRDTLSEKYAKERLHNCVPVRMKSGEKLILSPGEHSELIRAIIEEFAPRFAAGSNLVYVGDTGDKWGYFDAKILDELGIIIDTHGKMPDVVLYDHSRNWLLLIESVTSHGAVDGKRHAELHELFKRTNVGLVFVTAFPDRSTMSRYLGEIAWETEVWVADAPSHLIHFDGERFLGPYK